MLASLTQLAQDLIANDPENLATEIVRLRGIVARQAELLAMFKHVPVRVAWQYTREAKDEPDACPEHRADAPTNAHVTYFPPSFCPACGELHSPRNPAPDAQPWTECRVDACGRSALGQAYCPFHAGKDAA